jgi:serine/threonine protein kinase
MKFEGDDIPNIYSQHLKSIIKMCLEKNPNDRPTADELLKTPYFLRVM